ncbi:hypothetical protein DT75_10400 [Neisseria gonorrhoeae]|uniref:hypothetical protein n=1 Tax=Neisseria gonorrhoeae TaxID=485 RepID=UPI0004D89A1A|nr:hypothetical protein [Neisseria gonorrhoeae]KEC86752.1 hypothetical protein DT75_10400 [Neisseria gonorrhoeae]KGI95865.1 hypothetical protein IX30_08755 [Neisseria gonorrhoeae]
MPSENQTAFSFGDFEMTVKLKAPEGFTDVSFGSQSYAADENGIVEVPSEAAEFLYQFGFGNVASEPAEGPEKAKRGRKPKTGQPAGQSEPAEPAEPAEAEAEAEAAEPAEAEAEPAEAEKAE